MADEVLGRGKIIVEVQQNVDRELRKAEADFDRAMARLDRKEAEISLDINTKDFHEGLRKAEAELEALKKERAEVVLGADTKDLDEKIKKTQIKIDKLKTQKANTEIGVDTSSFDVDITRAEAELKAFSREKAKVELTAASDVDEKVAKAELALKRFENDNVKLYNKIKQLDDDRSAQEDKLAQKKASLDQKIDAAYKKYLASQEAAAQKSTNQITKANNRAVNLRIRDAVRETNELGKLRDNEAKLNDQRESNYERNVLKSIKLQKQRQQLEQSQTKVFQTPDERREVKVKLELNARDLAEVNAELHAIGKPPPHVDIEIDADKSRLAGFAASLSDTAIRLGPFTTSIGGAVRALALIGPVILGVVGAVGALVSVVGAASIGFAGLAAGGLGAFGLVLGSTALLLPTMFNGLKDLTTLQSAYQKEVLKSGAGSEKAKEALKQYNDALGRAPKTTREAVKGWGEIKDAWRDLGKKSEPAFMKAINEGVKTGKSLIKDLGPEVTESFGLVAKGAEAMFKGLRSNTAKGIFKDLFDSGQKALPSFGRGLGNLAEAAGRISAAFAKIALPDASKGFEKWTQGILDFASNGDKVSNVVKKTTGALSSLGHFLQSSTKFLIAFFGQGVSPGIGLLDRMTGALDRWTTSINSNPDGLKNFFGDSVKTTEDLYQVIVPLAQAFMEWATLMRPFANIALQFAAAMLKIGNAIFGLAGTKAILVGLFGTFLVGNAFGKILGIVGALKELRLAFIALGASQVGFKALDILLAGFPSKIRNIRRASVAANTATVASTAIADVASSLPVPVGRRAERTAVKGATRAGVAVAETAGIAAVGSKAAGAAGKMGLLRAGVLAVGDSFGIASLTGSAFATGGLALVAGAAVYGAYKLITMRDASDKLKDSIKQTGDATKNLITTTDAHANAVVAVGNATREYRDDIGTVAELKKQLNELEAKGGTNTQAYKDKLDQVNDALVSRTQNEQAQSKAQEASHKSEAESQKYLGMAKKSREDLTKALELQKDRQKDLDDAEDKHDQRGAIAAEGKLAEAKKLTAAAQDRYNKYVAAAGHYDRQHLVDILNYQRALKNFKQPIEGDAGTATAKLAKRAPQLTQTIATKYADPKDVGKVATRASAALKAGVKGDLVKNIVINSKSADEAIRKINAQLRGLNAYKAAVKIGLKDETASKIRSIITNLGNIPPGQARITAKDEATRKIAKIITQVTTIPSGVAKLIAKDLISGKIPGIKKLLGEIPETKTTTVSVNAAQAASTLRSIGSLLGGLVSKSLTITTFKETKNKGAGQAMGGRFATGGNTSIPDYGTTPANKPQLPNLIDWAANRASANTKSTKGGKYSRPTYLVGEENRDEFVIATNPVYKKRNAGLLKQAASALGFDISPQDPDKKKTTQPSTSRNKKGDNVTIAAAKGIANVSSTTGWTPSFDVAKAPKSPGTKPPTIKRSKKVFRNKTTKGLKSGRAWVGYITGLETQQDDLEKEISTRSSKVEEPSSLTKEEGRIIIDVPNADGKGTHKEDLGPRLVTNTPDIENYKAGLQEVQNAMDALIRVIQAIIVGIPQAISAIATEDAFRRHNINTLKDSIERDEKIISNHKKGTGKKGKVAKEDKAIVDRAQGRLSGEKKDIDYQRDQRKVIAEDKSTLTGYIKEAGTDLKDAQIDSLSNQADILGVDKKASDEAQNNNQGLIDDALRSAAEGADPAFNDPSNGGGPGGGSEGPTLQQQTGMADTERANILKQYGGNMGAITSNGAAGHMSGGIQYNTSKSNPMGAIGAAVSSAAAAVTSSAGLMTGGMNMASAMTSPATNTLMGSAGGDSAAPLTAGSGTTNKVVNITNNFSQPPPSPHEWSAGVGFEASALI